jgi:transcriptional regulator with XRE-family HTH domain
MSDLAKCLGRRIYEFRKQSRLTQAALAEKARISNEFMSAVERGAKLPSLRALERIATALRVEIKDLFNFDRVGYRRPQPLSRKVLDLAVELGALPGDQRKNLRVILRMLRAKGLS